MRASPACMSGIVVLAPLTDGAVVVEVDLDGGAAVVEVDVGGAAVVGGAVDGGAVDGGAAARAVVCVVVVAADVVGDAGAGWLSEVFSPLDPVSTVNAPTMPTTNKRAARIPNTATPFRTLKRVPA